MRTFWEVKLLIHESIKQSVNKIRTLLTVDTTLFEFVITKM